MSYYFNTVMKNTSFQQAIAKVTEELKKEGFGILNSIDMREVLKNKLGVNFKRYVILGACNPQFAHQALNEVDKIGLLLPCNIVIEEHENGDVEVAIVNPLASMSPVKNNALEELAEEVRGKLLKVNEQLGISG